MESEYTIIMTDTLIEKIRKLMDRTTSKGATEAEAESAAKIAAKLMEQYRIQEAEIFGIKEENIEVKTIMSKSSNQNKCIWKGELLNAICKVNSCRAMWMGPSLLAIGHCSNIENVEYLYSHLVKQVDILAKVSSVGMGKSYANSFRIGMVRRILDRLLEGWTEARNESNSRAIVLLDKKDMEVNEYIKNIATGKYKANIKIDKSAFHKGYAAGGNVSLNKELTNNVKYLPSKS